METLIPWEVLAFWALLIALIVWPLAPARWHTAARSTIAGRALVAGFGLLAVAVYASMLT